MSAVSVTMSEKRRNKHKRTNQNRAKMPLSLLNLSMNGHCSVVVKRYVMTVLSWDSPAGRWKFDLTIWAINCSLLGLSGQCVRSFVSEYILNGGYSCMCSLHITRTYCVNQLISLCASYLCIGLVIKLLMCTIKTDMNLALFSNDNDHNHMGIL